MKSQVIQVYIMIKLLTLRFPFMESFISRQVLEFIMFKIKQNFFEYSGALNSPKNVIPDKSPLSLVVKFKSQTAAGITNDIPIVSASVFASIKNAENNTSICTFPNP